MESLQAEKERQILPLLQMFNWASQNISGIKYKIAISVKMIGHKKKLADRGKKANFDMLEMFNRASQNISEIQYIYANENGIAKNSLQYDLEG